MKGEKEKKLVKKVQVLFHLNKRYAEDAVMQAKAVLSSQKKLLPIRIEGVQAKIQKTERKIEDYQTGKKTSKKVALAVCLAGLQARLHKLREKEAVLLKHQKTDTIPPVIFGGKKSFYERIKGKITNKEWKELRSNTLYSRGDQSKKGNLNTRIVFDDQDQQFYLEGELIHCLWKRGKIVHGCALNSAFLINILLKLRTCMPTTVGKNAKGETKEYKVYSIEIKRKKERYYVHITYDADEVGSELTWSDKITSDYIAGIDVNIDRVAVSVVSKQGNLARVQNLLLS